VGETLKRGRPGALRATVNWAVLGLVIERPSYGYELWNRFERQWGDVIDVSGAPSIYSALNRLKEKAYIEEFPSPQSKPRGGRQPKPWNRATGAGLFAYEAWVIDQAREHSRRSGQFARLLGALAGQPGTAIAILDRYEQACLDDTDSRIPVESHITAAPAPGLAERLESAYGRSLKAATLGWIAVARREFEELERQKRADESS
jgi:DNA-binding PadR family transcriptional regulator